MKIYKGENVGMFDQAIYTIKDNKTYKGENVGMFDQAIYTIKDN